MGWCTPVKRYFIVPITSMLTFGLTGYISWIYWTVFLPAMFANGDTFLAVFFLCTFSWFPIFIYWAVIMIVCKGPGVVTKDLEEKMLRDNNIDIDSIGTTITKKDAIEMMTLNSLIKSGLVSR